MSIYIIIYVTQIYTHMYVCIYVYTYIHSKEAMEVSSADLLGDINYLKVHIWAFKLFKYI